MMMALLSPQEISRHSIQATRGARARRPVVILPASSFFSLGLASRCSARPCHLDCNGVIWTRYNNVIEKGTSRDFWRCESDSPGGGQHGEQGPDAGQSFLDRRLKFDVQESSSRRCQIDTADAPVERIPGRRDPNLVVPLGFRLNVCSSAVAAIAACIDAKQVLTFVKQEVAPFSLQKLF